MFHPSAKGVLRGTLLLLFLLLVRQPAQARHRDTLGVGSPAYFVQNRGQWHDNVRFKACLSNATLYAEAGRFTFRINEPPSKEEHRHHPMPGPRSHVYRTTFVGASNRCEPIGLDIDATGGYDNYYYGNQPDRWATHLPHYMTLLYADLYPGIDMDVQVASNAMKTNFYIQPGSDPRQIAMRYEGAEKIYLSGGNLVIRTSLNEIVELRPYAYQIDGKEQEVECRYTVRDSVVRFLVGTYDTTQALVIDPELIFSSYTGSESDNWGTTATFDTYKNTYTAGLVFNDGYPVSTGAFQTRNANEGVADIGIFKFDTSGSQRLYATYLGGLQADMPHSLFVNTFDELIVFGTTGSYDFPVTTGAYCTQFHGGTTLNYEDYSGIAFPNGSDIFVSRFSSDGTQLRASTYVGGTGNDGLNYHSRFNNDYHIYMFGNDSLYANYGDGARGEIITDDLNNVYVGSTTMSANFPTTSGCIMPSVMGNRQYGVVFKLDYNLKNLIWSTYLGGHSGYSAVYSIDVDSAYNLLVCGGTTASDFPTTEGALQTTYNGGSADGFISKISYGGTQLMASTFMGSSAYDQCYFVRCGKHDDVFIYGQTKASGSTMIYNAGYSVPGAGMLLARLDPDLSTLRWSTVFGTPTGRPNLSPTAFACDICNRIYATGWGRDFVNYGNFRWSNITGTNGLETTSDAIMDYTDGQDFYIMSMSADASTLDFGTFFGEYHHPEDSNYGEMAYYYGADHVDGGTSRFDKLATLYQSVCGGCHGSDNFPTTVGAWSRTNRSNNPRNCNNAVFRLNVHDDFPVAEFITPPVGCEPYVVQFQNIGRGDSFLWNFGDGTTSTAKNPQHTFDHAGSYTVRLIATQTGGCTDHDTMTATIRVLSEQGTRSETRAKCNGEPMQIGPRPMLGCTYTWIQGTVSDSNVANPWISTSGTYILQLQSDDGCIETDTFVVQYVDLLDTLLLTNPRCIGGSDGQARVVMSGTVGDSIHIYWDGIEGDTLLTGLAAGERHTLHIEGYGCSVDRSFTLNDPEPLQITKESCKALCSDSCDGWIRLEWGYPDYAVGDTLIDHLCAGTFPILIHDTAGCPYHDTTTIIRDTSLSHMRAWADDTLIFLNESTHLHATPVPGALYTWSQGHTLDNPLARDPLATPEDTLTTYIVNVTDEWGCTWQGEVTLHCTEVLCGKPNIFIPNAFSPNGDGINDQLCFRGNFVLDFHMSIFSRWGEKVFETHDIHDCWDGRYNGNWCMPGVYTYTCKITCEANEETLLKGDITLIR